MPKLQFDIASVAGISDPREMPAYSIAEAAHYLRIPASTVRAWTSGTTTGKDPNKKQFDPVITPPLPDKADLSFNNLAEIFVLRSLREFQVRLEHIREAIQSVREEKGYERPLIQEGFRTDGVHLFVDRLGELRDAVSRQLLLPGMKRCLSRIEWEESLASRLYPFTREDTTKSVGRPVVIDYRRSYGRPIVDRLGITTSIVYSRWQAGDSIPALAKDYRCTRREIEETVCYEAATRKAA